MQFAVHRGDKLVEHMFCPKSAPSPSGIVTPRNTLFLGPSPVIIPNGISIRSALFVWVLNAVLYNALSTGKKTPKLSLPLGILSPCQRRTEPGPWATCTKIWKKGACGSGDILTDRQTDTLTDVLIAILRHRPHGRNNKYAITK